MRRHDSCVREYAPLSAPLMSDILSCFEVQRTDNRDALSSTLAFDFTLSSPMWSLVTPCCEQSNKGRKNARKNKHAEDRSRWDKQGETWLEPLPECVYSKPKTRRNAGCRVWQVIPVQWLLQVCDSEKKEFLAWEKMIEIYVNIFQLVRYLYYYLLYYLLNLYRLTLVINYFNSGLVKCV